MKFEIRNTRIELNLQIVKGSDYWSDKDGDLYCIDIITREAYPVQARKALESVLSRKNLKNDPTPDRDHFRPLGSIRAVVMSTEN